MENKIIRKDRFMAASVTVGGVRIFSADKKGDRLRKKMEKLKDKDKSQP